MAKSRVEIFKPVNSQPQDESLRLVGPVVFVGLPHTGKWPFAKAIAERFGVNAYKICNNLSEEAKLAAEASLSRKLKTGEICAASMVFGASYATTSSNCFIVAVAAPHTTRINRRAQNKRIEFAAAKDDIEEVDNGFREAIRPSKVAGKILHSSSFHMSFATNDETGDKLTARFMKEFIPSYKKWLQSYNAAQKKASALKADIAELKAA